MSNMNKKQKCVLIIVGVVIFLMLIYPPFHYSYKNERYARIDCPPAVDVNTLKMFHGRDLVYIIDTPIVRATINNGTLVTQWLGVLIIGGIAWLLLRDRK